jgi:hypothetical protein
VHPGHVLTAGEALKLVAYGGNILTSKGPSFTTDPGSVRAFVMGSAFNIYARPRRLHRSLFSWALETWRDFMKIPEKATADLGVK